MVIAIFNFQSWCATGNCFSSQKEHDVAIKYFQRAVQVNSTHCLLMSNDQIIKEYKLMMFKLVFVDSKYFYDKEISEIMLSIHL